MTQPTPVNLDYVAATSYGSREIVYVRLSVLRCAFLQFLKPLSRTERFRQPNTAYYVITEGEGEGKVLMDALVTSLSPSYQSKNPATE